MPDRQETVAAVDRWRAGRVWHVFASAASLAVAARALGVHSTAVTVAGTVCVLIALGGFLAWLPSQKGRDWRGRPIDRVRSDEGPDDAVARRR